VVDVRIKFSLARFDYSSLYSIPRSPKDLYIAQSLYTQTLRFDSTEKLYLLFFAEREPPVDQLITDFPNRPNMSTLISRILRILLIPRPAAQVCLVIQWTSHRGWLISCQTWWKMDWTWWKMLMLGIDMSWWILLLWCIDWTESLIPVLVCTLHIINHASLEHGINTIAAANKAPEGVYLLSKQKIGYDFWDKKTATPARGNAWLWHYHLHFGFYRYMYIHMIHV